MSRKAPTNPAQMSIMWAPGPAPATPAAPAPVKVAQATPQPQAPASLPAAPPPAGPWVDALPLYLDWLQARRLSWRTIRGYHLELRALERAAGRPLVALTAADLNRWIAGAVARELATGTILRKQIAARCFYRWCAEQDEPAIAMADQRPYRKFVQPKGPKRLRRHLTPEERQSLLAALDAGTKWGARDAALVALLYYTGMRVGELVTVQVSDIREDEEAVRVIGKGDKQRDIIIPQDAGLWPWLAAWMPFHPTGHGPIVTGYDGRPLDTDKARDVLARVLRRAGLEGRGITPHVLRHDYAHRLCIAEIPIEQIQIQMGHASIATTQGYAHALVTEKTRKRLGTAL